MFSRVGTFALLAFVGCALATSSVAWAEGPGTPADTLTKVRQYREDEHRLTILPGGVPSGVGFTITEDPINPPDLLPAMPTSELPKWVLDRRQGKNAYLSIVADGDTTGFSELTTGFSEPPAADYPIDPPDPVLIRVVPTPEKIENFIDQMGPWSPLHKYR